MRRSLAWLVAVPLMLAGSQLAHAVAYRLVYPQAHERLRGNREVGLDQRSHASPRLGDIPCMERLVELP